MQGNYYNGLSDSKDIIHMHTHPHTVVQAKQKCMGSVNTYCNHLKCPHLIKLYPSLSQKLMNLRSSTNTTYLKKVKKSILFLLEIYVLEQLTRRQTNRLTSMTTLLLVMRVVTRHTGVKESGGVLY